MVRFKIFYALGMCFWKTYMLSIKYAKYNMYRENVNKALGLVETRTIILVELHLLIICGSWNVSLWGLGKGGYFYTFVCMLALWIQMWICDLFHKRGRGCWKFLEISIYLGWNRDEQINLRNAKRQFFYLKKLEPLQ